MRDTITIDHGSGGKLTSALIEKLIVPSFQNQSLNELKDGAVLQNQNKPLVFSTDSFVVDPWKFPGGDIGKLAICGTNNDILMAGGIPKYISCSLIIEEGFLIQDLKEILHSMKETAKQCNVTIVTGDTKVIEKQKGNQIFINTSGIGFLNRETSYDYEEDDVLILSGSMARHGASIFMAREDIELSGELISDCAPLNEIARKAMSIQGLRIMRDPTRGGVATTCIELIEKTDFGIDIFESELPVDKDVQTLCSLLGFDPLYLACEGRMLVISSKDDAQNMLVALGKEARVIGKLTKLHPKELYLKTKLGATRRLRKLSGQPLPRIC